MNESRFYMIQTGTHVLFGHARDAWPPAAVGRALPGEATTGVGAQYSQVGSKSVSSMSSAVSPSNGSSSAFWMLTSTALATAMPTESTYAGQTGPSDSCAACAKYGAKRMGKSVVAARRKPFHPLLKL